MDHTEEKIMNSQNPVILCVDDEAVNLSLLEAILDRNGYQVICVSNGIDALLRIKGQQIDLVIMDVTMPGMDGLEVCRKIKEDQKLRSIPVIIVTSLSAKQDRIRGIEAGAEEFVSKPFDPTDVLARIKLLLKVKQLNEDLNGAEKALRKSHDELECKVHERTTELAQANKILETEVLRLKQQAGV